MKNDTKQSFGEEMFFFPGGNENRLFGFLHYPEKNTRNTGIVFCHPFADEKNTSHVVSVRMSRELASMGFHVLRFDLSGCGDSQGDMNEFTVFDWLLDVEAAVSTLKSKTNIERLVLWGIRFGGGLALLHAARNPGVSSLVLWQPVLDFKEYINQFLFKQFASQDGFKALQGNSVAKLIEELNDSGEINVIGYPISREMHESFLQIGAEPLSSHPDCRILLISISPLDKPVLKIKRYAGSLEEKPGNRFSHFKAEPFWDRYWRRDCPEADSETVNWANEI